MLSAFSFIMFLLEANTRSIQKKSRSQKVPKKTTWRSRAACVDRVSYFFEIFFLYGSGFIVMIIIKMVPLRCVKIMDTFFYYFLFLCLPQIKGINFWCHNNNGLWWYYFVNEAICSFKWMALLINGISLSRQKAGPISKWRHNILIN